MSGTNFLEDVIVAESWPAAGSKLVGVGEFTGTEQAHILWRDYTTGSNFIWLMQGTVVSNIVPLQNVTDTNWQIQGVADYNGDGIADILWRHAVTGSNEIWLTSNPLGTSYTNVVLPQLTNVNWTIAGPK
jgi:hypothetical protein